MPPSERSMQIAGKFSEYAKSGDDALIQNFTENEIKLTLIQYAQDKRFPHYSAMEMQLQKLQEQKRELLSQNEREAERKEGYKNGLITGIISGVIGGIILAVILKLLGLG